MFCQAVHSSAALTHLYGQPCLLQSVARKQRQPQGHSSLYSPFFTPFFFFLNMKKKNKPKNKRRRKKQRRNKDDESQSCGQNTAAVQSQAPKGSSLQGSATWSLLRPRVSPQHLCHGARKPTALNEGKWVIIREKDSTHTAELRKEPF